MLPGQSPAVVLEAVRAGWASAPGIAMTRRWAELLCDVVPSAELVVFSKTGAEAVQPVLRVPHAAADRNPIIKFSDRLESDSTATRGLRP
jgi:glutamate-1-semialdehyde aminotransferase